MATIAYKYQRITKEKMLEAIRYLGNKMQLRDWELKLDTEYEMPGEFKEEDSIDLDGMVHIAEDELKALIWVPLKRLRVADKNPLETLCHEMFHIEVIRCGKIGEGFNEELHTRINSPVWYRDVCKHIKIRVAKTKE